MKWLTANEDTGKIPIAWTAALSYFDTRLQVRNPFV